MSRRGRGGRNRQHGKHGGPNGRPGQQFRQDTRPTVQKNDRNHELNQQGTQTNDPRNSGNSSKSSFQSAIQPKRTLSRPAKQPAVTPPSNQKKYGVIFFDTISQAKSDFDNLKQLATTCDQLNIVVKAEGSMDDPELTSIGKLFCGAAWTLIHERRRDAGWYEQNHE